MKLIQKFKSYNYGATNYVYQFENGLRLFVTEKKDILDFYASIIFKAGALIENQVGVTDGTAHFLEHLMVASPSKYFKSMDVKKEFMYGNLSRPEVNYNGSTSKYAMQLYSSSQIRGKERVMKMLKGYLDSSKRDFETTIEKERGIILSEIERMIKKEKDSGYYYREFFFQDVYPEFVKYVIGEYDQVKEINIEQLDKFRTELSRGENAVIAIQTNNWPDKTLIKDIKELSKYFNAEKNSFKHKFIPYKNQFKYKHFKDEERRDVFISYNVFLPKRDHIDYRLEAIEEFADSLISKTVFEHLREDKQLIYSGGSFNQYALVSHINRGFSTSVSKEKLPELLDSIEYLFTTYWKEFLFSQKGAKWFGTIVSSYLFKTTTSFDLDFPRSMAMDLLYGEEVGYDYRKATKAIKEISREDVANYLDHYLSIAPGLWLVSPHEEKEIYDILESSSFFKRVSKLTNQI